MTSEKNVKKPAASKGQKRTITLRLVKGRIGASPNQRATLLGLGLKARHSERTLENTPSVRGMIKKVIQMVEIVSETR